MSAATKDHDREFEICVSVAKGETYEEIGTRHGISRQRAHQIWLASDYHEMSAAVLAEVKKIRKFRYRLFGGVTPPGLRKHGSRGSRTVRAILAWDGPMTAPALAASTGMSRASFACSLNRLYNSGQIRKVRWGVYENLPENERCHEHE